MCPDINDLVISFIICDETHVVIIHHLINQAAQQYNNFPTSPTEVSSFPTAIHTTDLTTTDNPRCRNKNAFVPCWDVRSQREDTMPDMPEVAEAVKTFALVLVAILVTSIATTFMWLKYSHWLNRQSQNSQNSVQDDHNSGTRNAIEPPPSYDELMHRDALWWAEMAATRAQENARPQVMITRVEFITEVSDEEDEPPSYAQTMSEAQTQ